MFPVDKMPPENHKVHDGTVPQMGSFNGQPAFTKRFGNATNGRQLYHPCQLANSDIQLHNGRVSHRFIYYWLPFRALRVEKNVHLRHGCNGRLHLPPGVRNVAPDVACRKPLVGIPWGIFRKQDDKRLC